MKGKKYYDTYLNIPDTWALKYFVMIQGLENMCNLAQKCMHLKPISNHHKLMGLIIGILEENIEVGHVKVTIAFLSWLGSHIVKNHLTNL